MGINLVMIERAYRGGVEQQYAHVLWLAHGLHRQQPLAVLLRGPATAYALAGIASEPVEVAGERWGAAPDYHAAIGRLHADGARVYVSTTSLSDLGAIGPLLPGITPLSDDEIVKLIAECDRWWCL